MDERVLANGMILSTEVVCDEKSKCIILTVYIKMKVSGNFKEYHKLHLGYPNAGSDFTIAEQIQQYKK